MRQKDYRRTGRREQYNAEGYKDITAYLALRNIEREERAKRYEKRRQRKPAFPPQEKLSQREDEMFAWEELANAIIIRAAEDWREAKRILREYPSSREAARTVRETEAFFLSEYYSTLTNVDGRMLLNRLRKEFGENEL